MKELLICCTVVFSVVTQRSLAGRSVENDFLDWNKRTLDNYHTSAAVVSLFLSLPSAASGKEKLAG